MEPISQLQGHVQMAMIISTVNHSTASTCKVYFISQQNSNELALVDYKKRFLDIEVGYPGSVGDARIFECSWLNRAHQDYLEQIPTSLLVTGIDDNDNAIESQIPAFFLADSAYRNTKHIVTTYKVTECDADPDVAALNRRLGGARYHVENAFGIMKGRFRIFKIELANGSEDIYFTNYLIAAIFILHNFLIDERDEIAEEERDIVDILPRQEASEVGNNGGGNGGRNREDQEETTRDILLRWTRWLRDGD